ncbi:uncharacterized protein LOC133927977 [Phragmites australis]|uniref:uncharacterized protein LOC133927977 n=1 Tax=Phragmites australis TaxID=29695 RepID=UPI002D77ED54|nr:uncharacterized protein LOC133927977 [Phragmites australis]
MAAQQLGAMWPSPVAGYSEAFFFVSGYLRLHLKPLPKLISLSFECMSPPHRACRPAALHARPPDECPDSSPPYPSSSAPLESRARGGRGSRVPNGRRQGQRGSRQGQAGDARLDVANASARYLWWIPPGAPRSATCASSTVLSSVSDTSSRLPTPSRRSPSSSASPATSATPPCYSPSTSRLSPPPPPTSPSSITPSCAASQHPPRPALPSSSSWRCAAQAPTLTPSLSPSSSSLALAAIRRGGYLPTSTPRLSSTAASARAARMLTSTMRCCTRMLLGLPWTTRVGCLTKCPSGLQSPSWGYSRFTSKPTIWIPRALCSIRCLTRIDHVPKDLEDFLIPARKVCFYLCQKSLLPLQLVRK